MAEFEAEDWTEVVRLPSSRNPAQEKSRVQIKRRQQGDEVVILSERETRSERPGDV